MNHGRTLTAANISMTSMERHALRSRRFFGFDAFSLSEP